ncbi:MAG: bifunctional aspartate kinase/homoserine dehydrogenase I, partial [Bacteroidota bacterium]
IHLFSIGVGLIGGTLLEQIRHQAAFLEQERSLEIRVVGISNSKKMLFTPEGIDLENWKGALSTAETAMSFEGFVNKMKDLNLRNSIFIDNTANKEIIRYYPTILDSSISISTPNKIAVSSDYQSYLNLKGLAQKRGVHMAYETNVGAGLPVLTTLRDLITSGDRIQKIEGVLSGSLSFIFYSFNKDIPFSTIVKEAQAAGYTEPDPREDLSGADVRRKLLILARESGYAYESEDIEVKGILPEDCMAAPDVPAFFKALEANDDHFTQLIAAAESEGKVLRFIAKLEQNKAQISLEMVGPEHPFYSLSGSDNMIVFTTDRYHSRPLVVRGPGAGAEVTAAGVFAEIISISNQISA